MSAPILKFGLNSSSLPASHPTPEDEDGAARPLPPIREDVDAALQGAFDGQDQVDVPSVFQRMLRLDLAFFASEVIRGPREAPYNGRFLVAPHHEEWAETARKHKQFCIIAPRDHGKSHSFTIALPIWEAWRRPGCEIAIFSETQPQAEGQLAKLKDEIENNPRLAHLKDPALWNAGQIRLTNGSTIKAKGFGVKARGMHPHLIICDDVVSEAAMYSQLVRDRQANYFFAAIRNMLVPGGTIAVIGTPQHAEDLYGLIEKNSEWYFKRYTALEDVRSPDGSRHFVILWPERYSLKTLEARRREIGEIRFAREFLGRPVASGSSLIPDHFVTGMPFLQHTARCARKMGDGSLARKWWKARGVHHFYIGVDIAISANTGSDYFVIFVIGLDEHGNRWVVEIYRERGLDYKVQKAQIADAGKAWQAELICIEGNAAQQIYGQELKQDTDLPVFLHFTGAEKNSLEDGIPSLRILFENGKYRAPRGDDDSIIATDIWIGELQAWTFQNGKIQSVARHDDCAMAQYLCEKAIERGEAFTFSMGEQGDDRAAAEQQAAEEAALIKEMANDPFLMMGLLPEDMTAGGTRRGNLDFGVSSPAAPSPGPAPDLSSRRAHPLGPNVPSFGNWRPN